MKWILRYFDNLFLFEATAIEARDLLEKAKTRDCDARVRAIAEVEYTLDTMHEIVDR